MKRSQLLSLSFTLLLGALLFLSSCSKLEIRGVSKKFRPDLVFVYWGELMGQLDPSG